MPRLIRLTEVLLDSLHESAYNPCRLMPPLLKSRQYLAYRGNNYYPKGRRHAKELVWIGFPGMYGGVFRLRTTIVPRE